MIKAPWPRGFDSEHSWNQIPALNNDKWYMLSIDCYLHQEGYVMASVNVLAKK